MDRQNPRTNGKSKAIQTKSHGSIHILTYQKRKRKKKISIYKKKRKRATKLIKKATNDNKV